MWLEKGRILVCIPGFLVFGLGEQVGNGYVNQDKEHKKRAVFSVLDLSSSLFKIYQVFKSKCLSQDVKEEL